MEKKKIAILIGNGGRLKTICEKCPKNAEIVSVISFKKKSKGIDYADDKDILNAYFRVSDYTKFEKTRQDLENELANYLLALKVNLIVMAGWMLLMSNDFLQKFPMKVINIHPALNPAFPGAHGVEDAFEYGAKVTGATVHFVPDNGVDSGPIIIQKATEILQRDTLISVTNKIHAIEEEILPQAIEWFCNEQLEICGKRVKIMKK
ncbi:MAG: phosphoribosylglycinamide formyltransferase [Patescibacteria group bacterium]